jgi:hypothetical protein
MSAIAQHPPLQVIDAKRRKALVVPREHGAWGILLIPLVCGATLGLMNHGRPGYILPFAVAAFTVFWLRTPLESWLGRSAMKAQSDEELRLVRQAVAKLSIVSLITFAMIFWGGQNLGLVWFGVVASAAFLVQAFLKKSRDRRALAEVIGAAGLTATGPACYYLATGAMDRIGWAIWIACFLFAANQIHYVQTRIRAARPLSPREKLALGRGFVTAQFAVLFLLATVCWMERTLWPVTLAFVPTLYRGFAWFARGPEPLKIHALGWSEMRQAVAFGILLIAGFAFAWR